MRAAIEDLAATCGDRYPRGQEFLDRLDHLLSRLLRASLGEVEEIGEAFDSLRREAILANPLVSGQPVVFITRPQYVREHGTEATMYQTAEINTHCFRGGVMKLLHLPSGELETLLETPQGIIRDPEVHFDGQRGQDSGRHSVQGLRIGSERRASASASATNCSLSGFHFSFRPRRIEILPMCSTVAQRCPTSAGK